MKFLKIWYLNFWHHFGTQFGPHGAFLGSLGPSWAPFGPATLGPLVAILRPPGPSGGHRGEIWVPFCLILDKIWTFLGSFWHHFLHIPDRISSHKDCCVFMFVFCAVAFSSDFHYSKQKISCKKHAIHAHTQCGEAECAERLNIVHI